MLPALIMDHPRTSRQAFYPAIQCLRWHKNALLGCPSCAVVLTNAGTMHAPYEIANRIAKRKSTRTPNQLIHGKYLDWRPFPRKKINVP
jgi:hypothetical protein